MRNRIALLAAALAAGSAVVAVTVPARRTVVWCDPVSGSLKEQTTWPFGVTTAPRYEPSRLEARLRAIGYPWQQNWQRVGQSRETLSGRQVDYQSDVLPPICDVASVLGWYAPNVPPDEVRHFADAMRFGTEAEQRAAVKHVQDFASKF